MKKIIGIIILGLACCLNGYSQGVAGLGAISGTVRDATGAIIPGVSVVVSNESKGVKRELITTEAGIFAVPALVPASGYTLTVSLNGFRTWEAKAFVVEVGQTVDFKVVLQVAGATTEVAVTADAPVVDTDKSGVAEVVSQVQIDNLPINGRRVDTFVLLTPAVTNDGEFGLVSFRGIAMGNAFLTDGNDTTNSYYNENAGRTRISTQISQDAVQEFQVLSDGFSAEFGRAMGGVVNTVTRSGTNAIHGTGYEFFRNRTLEAADRYSTIPGYVAPAGTVSPRFRTPEWRHQAGGSLGGPVQKDKVFYFGNFEIVKRNFPGLNRIINSAFTDAQGTLLPSTCTATAAECAAAINFLQRQMNVLVPRTVGSALGFVKLDWVKDSRNTFSFDANIMHWRSPHGIQTQGVLTSGNMIGNNGNSTVETRYGKAAWTSVLSPTMVNELRFGWFKDRLSDPAASDLWPAETGGLYLTINSATVGAAQAYPRTLPSEQRFQVVDNYNWTRGSHAMKFGFDFQTTGDFMSQLFNGRGAYSYSTLTNFARDFTDNPTGAKNYTTFTQAFGQLTRNFRTTDVNFYVQDAWKPNTQLTVNWGLRYEKAFLPQPPSANPDFLQTGVIPQSSKNFAPRLSLSYSLDDKTVVRAGAGIFFARIHGNLLDTLYLGSGNLQTNISINSTQAGAPVFPNVFASATGLPTASVSLQYADENFRTPYTEQGTLAVERGLTRDLGVTVSYIWSHGVGLFVQRDVNLGAPVGPVTYSIVDPNGNQTGTYTTPVWVLANRVNPKYSKILRVENGGQSWYNGLVLQLNKRMSHGLSTKISYTWSHAIDDGNEQGASWNIASNFNNSTIPGDWHADKASSATIDQRHRMVVNFLWSPKFTNSVSPFARYLINGWDFSGIATVASAHPIAPTVNVSGTGQFTGITLANTTLNGSGGWNRVPFWSANSLDVDQIHRLDMRVGRDLPINENLKASLMFEAFNVFNMQYNTSINTQAYTATNGVLRPQVAPAATMGSGSASQGFPDGTNARRAQVSLRVVF